MINDDFAGSDVVRTTSYGYSSSYKLTNGYGRGEINDVMWDLVYDPINNCNAVLKNIDGISGDQEEKNRIKGQAYATRGFLYMLLASHYSLPSIKSRMQYVYQSIQNQLTTIQRPPESLLQVYRKYTNKP